jgi:hypothetical protein
MAEDPKISRRYRELPREEPSREIDAAILAAARRAAETRPAPLVVPTGRRRWYFPLAAAAIIVLAVAVTIHVEREQPDPELAVPPVTAPAARQEEQAVQPERKAVPMFTPDPKPEVPRELRAQRDAAPAENQAAPAPAPAPASPPAAVEEQPLAKRQQAPEVASAPPSVAAQVPTPQAKPAQQLREERARAALDRAAARPDGRSAFAHASPEQWLQGIADLRRQGRHEEADKALAEFRRTYPDYRISEAMLEKVEKK